MIEISKRCLIRHEFDEVIFVMKTHEGVARRVYWIVIIFRLGVVDHGSIDSN
jgi:hypothetical protein